MKIGVFSQLVVSLALTACGGGRDGCVNECIGVVDTQTIEPYPDVVIGKTRRRPAATRFPPPERLDSLRGSIGTPATTPSWACRT
jgi:hypothetical protein